MSAYGVLLKSFLKTTERLWSLVSWKGLEKMRLQKSKEEYEQTYINQCYSFTPYCFHIQVICGNYPWGLKITS